MTRSSPVSRRRANGCSTSGLDPDRAHDRRGGVAELLVGLVGKVIWGDGDGVARVHAHRVEVLDRAHDDDVVGAVADHLEPELVPAAHGLLDQDLVDRRLREATLDLPLEAARSSAKPPPCPPSVNAGRTTAGRSTSSSSSSEFTIREAGTAEPAAPAPPPGTPPGPRPLDDVHGCAADRRLRAPRALPLGERHQVERRLASERRQERVRRSLEHRGDALEVERLQVRAVGEPGVGHDRRRVRVDDDRPVPVLTGASRPGSPRSRTRRPGR